MSPWHAPSPLGQHCAPVTLRWKSSWSAVRQLSAKVVTSASASSKSKSHWTKRNVRVSTCMLLVLIGEGGKKVEVGTNTYMVHKTYSIRVSWPNVRCPIDSVADFGRDIILWMKVVMGMKCHALTKGTVIQPRIVIAAVVCLCVNVATRTFIISWGVFFSFLTTFFFFCPLPYIVVVDR